MENKAARRRICIMVGAGPGLGLAIANRFGRGGLTVVFISRRSEARKGYVNVLRDEGQNAGAIAADPGDPVSLKGAFDEIKDRLGVPEVLIYNAIVRGPRNTMSELDTSVLLEDYRLDVVNALFCAQQVIPGMRARKRGTILFTAGGYGAVTHLPYTTQAIGRAGVRILANSLGAELQPEGIQVATVIVRGNIQKGTRLDPDSVAEVYWKIHKRYPDFREHEIVFDENFERQVRMFRRR